jgi:transcription elongation factor GreA
MSTVQRKPMTPYGHLKLKKEIQKLREVDRPANVRAIEEARAHGDLSENAEYKYAKEQQSFIAGRIQEVEALLSVAEVIDPATLKGDRIVFGATVALLDVDKDEETSYTIVGQNESNAHKGRISIDSPIARSLIGKRVGDEVQVKTPGTGKKGTDITRTFEVLAVKFMSCEGWED